MGARGGGGGSDTSSTFQATAKLWGPAPQCLHVRSKDPWQSSTKLPPNKHKACYVPLCQGAALAVGCPRQPRLSAPRNEPKVPCRAGGLQPSLPGDVAFKLWRKKEAMCPYPGGHALQTPPRGQKALWVPSGKPRPPVSHVGEYGCRLPEEGRSWRGARLAEETS